MAMHWRCFSLTHYPNRSHVCVPAGRRAAALPAPQVRNAPVRPSDCWHWCLLSHSLFFRSNGRQSLAKAAVTCVQFSPVSAQVAGLVAGHDKS